MNITLHPVVTDCPVDPVATLVVVEDEGFMARFSTRQDAESAKWLLEECEARLMAKLLFKNKTGKPRA